MMLVGGKVDGKVELATNNNDASCNVRAHNWGGIPGVQGHEDAFLRHAVGAALGTEDGEAFVEVAVNTLNDHRIVVFARDDVDVDVQEARCRGE